MKSERCSQRKSWRNSKHERDSSPIAGGRSHMEKREGIKQPPARISNNDGPLADNQQGHKDLRPTDVRNLI